MTYKYLLTLLIVFLIFEVSNAQNFQDCNNTFPICEMKTYHFSSLEGYGATNEDFTDLRCTKSFKESNSIWLEWEASKKGVLSFVITPEEIDDDIDFVLFSKNEDCSSLKELRCMASGIIYGADVKKSELCKGSTGLSFRSIDDFEKSGCKYNDDNYLKYLNVDKGDHYLLLINNYDSTNGVSVTFEGTTVFSNLKGCETSNLQEEILVTDVFPNPTSNYVNVEFISTTERVTVLELLDISGCKYNDDNYLKYYFHDSQIK